MKADAVTSAKKLRIGLIANRSHQDAPNSALVQLLHGGGPALQHLQAELVIVGRTLDAIVSHGLLESCPAVERFPYGREGGLMKLVSRVVDKDPARAVDAVIYLIDPVDPSSVFPEAQALKRQCVIQRKPFLATLASAREWLELEATATGAPMDSKLNPTFELKKEGIALIAHDAMKESMLVMAEKHFALLDSFGHRYATGTTGGLLNQMAQRIKGAEAGKNWVAPYLSGPLGGDAQLAELVLDRQIRRILFLEDPHVARQHEADIQLLERAARTVCDFSQVISEVSGADRWLTLLTQRVSRQA
ncbi:methylglyoxal synthase [Undibacterium sp. Ji42W]|uniref:methylglyoxal synthase n=1 Tax=Undibacterium sp. Ji42W TaxID=3413039 RepID=UPI003BF440AC